MVGSISAPRSPTREFTDKFVSEHISPPPSVVTIPVGRCPKASLERLKLPDSLRSKEQDPSSFAFWYRLDSFCDALCDTELFKRVEEIYVSPQSASQRPTSEELPLESYVGSMTRAAHIKDVMRIAVQDLRERYRRNELTFDGSFTGEDIFYTLFATWAHDIAVFGQSHLTQDDLTRRKVKADHDINLIFATSCEEVRKIIDEFGLNHKEAVASALCPQFISEEPSVRRQSYKESKEQLEVLIKEDTINAQRYKLTADTFQSVLNFEPGHADQELIDTPKVAIRAALAHEIYDIAYSRTDISQSVKEEAWAATLLKHGKLGKSFLKAEFLGEDQELPEEQSGPIFRAISFADLPRKLQATLAAGGAPPSGDLYIGQVKNGREFKGVTAEYQVLLEMKGSEKIIRAIARGRKPEYRFKPSEGLTRVKIHKSISRFDELLRTIRPLRDGTFQVTQIDPLMRVFSGLGDYQSGHVGSMNSLVGVGFYEKANQAATVPVLVQLFGTHPDVTSHYLSHHQNAEMIGTGKFYRIISYLAPHSTVAGPSWNGGSGPDIKELDKTFLELKLLGEDLESRIREESNLCDFEVLTAVSPPLKKVYPLRLTHSAVQELKHRLRSGDKAQVVNGSVLYTRRSRSKDDLFSLSLEINVDLPNSASIDEICAALTTDTKVDLLYRLHKGFVLAVPDRLQTLVLPHLEWFQIRQREILATARFNREQDTTFTHALRFFP